MAKLPWNKPPSLEHFDSVSWILHIDSIQPFFHPWPTPWANWLAWAPRSSQSFLLRENHMTISQHPWRTLQLFTTCLAIFLSKKKILLGEALRRWKTSSATCRHKGNAMEDQVLTWISLMGRGWEFLSAYKGLFENKFLTWPGLKKLMGCFFGTVSLPEFVTFIFSISETKACFSSFKGGGLSTYWPKGYRWLQWRWPSVAASDPASISQTFRLSFALFQEEFPTDKYCPRQMWGDKPHETKGIWWILIWIKYDDVLNHDMINMIMYDDIICIIW